MSREAQTIFFSYARSDSEFVARLANDLRKAGKHIWVDQLDIPKGARWDQAVEAALKACPCLLVVLSPASTDSQNVLDEVSYALGEKKTVIPILLRECNIPFRLRRLQYVDFTADYERALEELRSALCDPRPSQREPQGGKTDTKWEPESVEEAAPDVVQERKGGSDFSGQTMGNESGIGRRRGSIVALAVVVAVLVGGLYLWSSGGEKPVVPSSSPPPAAEPSMQPAKALTPKQTLEPNPLPDAITEAQARDFVHRFIATSNSGNPTDLLQLYDNHVRYFNEGVVSKDFVLRDKQNYYRRWPNVHNEIVDDIVVVRSASLDSATMSFTISYDVRSPDRGDAKNGMAQDELVVRKVDGDLRITAEQQRIQPKPN